MTKVRTLKEDVYKKIAAGEVVERPLSAVKELVENAIDAGADSIKIEILEGGKRLIKVTDNGSGFEPGDIETAFKNHSTSKIRELNDFDSLNTLGFRGEALPSILEVSKIDIETSDNSDGGGILCKFEDAKLVLKEEIACSKGASIAIKDLFYNFPVRRRFLKTDRTELNQITSFLEPVTLVNYGIGFELLHNNKTVFLYKKSAGLKERIYQVFGKDFLDALQEVDFETDRYKLGGFISKLNSGVSVKKHQYYFVNGRPVKEKTLIASLNNSFQAFLEKGRHPVGILLFQIPPHEVDVNIHPMKLEIKFEDSNAIYRFIKHAIDSTMAGVTGVVPRMSYGKDQPGGQVPQYSMGNNSGYNYRESSGGGLSGYSGYSGGQESQAPAQGHHSAPMQTTPQSDFEQTQLFAGSFLSEDDFILLGQYKNSYILIEKNGDLLIVDQHNAVERANFDKLKLEYAKHNVTSIAPLFPVIIELSPSEAAALNEEKQEMLANIGFQLEPLSGNSFDVKGFPQILGEKSIKDALLEILHMAEDQVNMEDKVLAEVACKSAIKINHKLYPDEMKTIVRNLFKTTNPYFCPHKRPIIIELSLEKIEKMLKRR
ncbi:MAG: DNA mismatch repair endonuclease MutL [bacterium]|nr:DNA mismatch repair endonuclease MutL [bacterium]